MSEPLSVLMLEDCPDDAELILRRLRSGGYEPAAVRVDCAADLSHALNSRRWDIVIADYAIPGFSGLAALEMVRGRFPDLPFLIVSGAIGEETAVTAMKAGASDYIMKDRLARLPVSVARELRTAAVRLAARRAEQALQRFFTHSLDVLCIAGMDGYLKRFNPAFSETLGYTVEELLSLPYMSLVHPDDAAPTQREMATLADGAATLYFENRLRGRDGEYRWFAWKCAPADDGLLYATARDITENKRAEKALQDSRDRLRLALENARHGMWEWNVRTGEVSLDENWYAILGLAPGELAPIFQTWEQSIHPDDKQRVIADLERHLRFPESLYDVDYRSRHKSGSWIWINTRGRVCQRDDDGAALRMMGTIHDITERKFAEESLSLRAQELARSNAELEQFAYVASHDLREPLRMVQNFCTLLRDRYAGKLDDRADTYIDFAVDGAARMQRLVDDLLEFSRVGRSNERFELTPLDVVARRALANVAAVIEESKAQIDLSPLPTVFGDAARLEQVLQNLIGNAVKFRGPATPVIRISAERDQQGWRVSVTDNGIGIDPQHFPRLFVVFQRLHTRDEYDGTGIGLALCKRIVELHGGRIWLESQPGLGTSVHFILPAATPPAISLNERDSACNSPAIAV